MRLFAGAVRVAEMLTRTCPGLVPELLTWEAHDEGNWSLFAVTDGQQVEELHSQEALQAMARTLAQIQTVVAALPAAERTILPRVALPLLPRLYETVLRNVHERLLSYWAGAGRDLAEQFALPTNIVEQMEYFRPFIGNWTEELLAGDWPESLDHVDLHADNAIMRPDGNIEIYDWEEANLSSAFFSLDRLLDDARELEPLNTKPASTSGRLAYTPAEQALRDAYLAALPWGDPAARLRAFDLAMCLAPIKTAYEGIALAETLGWEEGSPHITAWALGRALPRWQAMARPQPPLLRGEGPHGR